ncbi:hypothetical protein DL95DRAFT_393413 [Leptodontidium sp. 2 PMI_412]|nr:hypothetical protein DL95DRAFT_393413 [Leptodontidium sp. 2 PMI_412]
MTGDIKSKLRHPVIFPTLLFRKFQLPSVHPKMAWKNFSLKGQVLLLELRLGAHRPKTDTPRPQPHPILLLCFSIPEFTINVALSESERNCVSSDKVFPGLPETQNCGSELDRPRDPEKEETNQPIYTSSLSQGKGNETSPFSPLGFIMPRHISTATTQSLTKPGSETGM